MNKHIIENGRTTFTRITKHQAEFPPNTPHSFEQAVKEFTHYNCVDRETGYYPAFYTMTYTY